MQQTVWDGLGMADGDMNCAGRFGGLTCPCVILYFAHIMHMFSSKL